MYLDSHVHFWKLDRGDYVWLKPENVLHRDFLPEDLAPQLSEYGTDGVILVQAAATAEETDYMLGLAETHPWIAGVVGSLPAYDRYGKHPLMRGIRVNGSSFHGDDAEFASALARMAEDGCPIDLLIRPDDMPHVARHFEKLPQVKAVVNHMGIPLKEGRLVDGWKEAIGRLAAFPNVYCKLSGFMTQAGGSRPERLREPFAHLFAVFGPERLLFGSDWPVATQEGGYGDVIRLFEASLPEGLSEGELQAVRSGNAARFYGVQAARGQGAPLPH